jgi:hypothetical protein
MPPASEFGRTPKVIGVEQRHEFAACGFERARLGGSLTGILLGDRGMGSFVAGMAEARRIVLISSAIHSRGVVLLTPNATFPGAEPLAGNVSHPLAPAP